MPRNTAITLDMVFVNNITEALDSAAEQCQESEEVTGIRHIPKWEREQANKEEDTE